MQTTVHDLDSAPDGAKPLLQNSIKTFGRLPSLHGVMATSPGLLEGYQTLHRLAIEATAFSPTERTVVWQSVNVRHACHYCVPAHTAIAHAEKIDQDVIDALRDETPLADPKLEALRTFTLAIVDSRGRPSSEQIAAFEAAGYGERAVLDVILIVAQKVMSNYTNALFATPIDDAFAKFVWSPRKEAAE